jgi:hypothetical protein
MYYGVTYECVRVHQRPNETDVVSATHTMAVDPSKY